MGAPWVMSTWNCHNYRLSPRVWFLHCAHNKKNVMGYWPEICWQLPLDRALSTRCFDLQKFLVHVLVISPFIRIIIRQEANSTNLAFQPFIYLKKRKTAWMLSLMINYVHTQQKLFAMVLFCLWESSLLKHFTDFLFIVHLEIWNDFISQDHLICVSMALRLTGN